MINYYSLGNKKKLKTRHLSSQLLTTTTTKALTLNSNSNEQLNIKLNKTKILTTTTKNWGIKMKKQKEKSNFFQMTSIVTTRGLTKKNKMNKLNSLFFLLVMCELILKY